MSVEERARELYEEVNGRLLYVTAAAWVRWENLEDEVRWMWITHVRRTT